MSDSPEAIRADIERTRSELGQDVDALSDKVNPSKIADRQTARIRGAFGSVRDRVMGVGDDAQSSVASAASGAVDGAAQVAHEVKAKATGSPLAVGLIAFGAGLLAAALVPASTKETRLAAAAKEQVQPLIDDVADAAKQAAGAVKEPAQEAATAVRERAQEAADTLASESTDAVDAVKERAVQARDTLSGS